MTDWWAGIAPAQLTIACAGEQHRIRWEHGRLLVCDHGDIDDESALAALGGEPFACVELARAWQRHRFDLRALVIGPRGGADELAGDVDDTRSGAVRRSRGRRRSGGNSVRTVGVTLVGTQTLGGRSAPSRSVTTADSGAQDDIEVVMALAELGGGFGERLVATVAAAWADRLREGGPEVPAAMARLHAALYGRVFAALRAWLGEPRLALELEMIDGAGAASLSRIGDAIVARLPFAWLVDVWARDLATIQGRFCLNAATVGGTGWELETVAPDLRTTQRIELRIDPVAGG